MDHEVIVTEVEFAPRNTPGGRRLRELRKVRGRTQLSVESEADLGSGYLQRVESGRVAQPSRDTIERILAALAARYGEARDVLEAFGYAVPAPLPTEAERTWARQTCQSELDEVMFPAYALDCTARLVAWNRYLPLLIGLDADASLPSVMTRRSLLFSWFDSRTPLGSTVAEPETLDPALARALKRELEQFRDESWPSKLNVELESLPRFRKAWRDAAHEHLSTGAARARVALTLTHPAAGTLEFRLAAESFAEDPRFRAIYLFPADPATMRWCANHASS